MKTVTGLWLLLALVCVSYPRQEIVDRIAALVNDEVITESDIGIVTSFGLAGEEEDPAAPPSRETVLERIIDRKLVIQLFGGTETLEDEDFQIRLSELKDRLGDELFRSTLEDFGLLETDLRPYLAEKLIYRRIISRRFNQSVRVTLREIELYYRDVLVPAAAEGGSEPPPLTDVLGEIESRIKQKKIEERIEEWLSNLRQQAEIQIIGGNVLAQAAGRL